MNPPPTTKKKKSTVETPASVAAATQLVARATLTDVEFVRQAAERAFAGASGGSSPMPDRPTVRPTVEVFTPKGEVRDACAYLVSLRVVWTAGDQSTDELAQVWVVVRMSYTFAEQVEPIDEATLQTFGEGVVRNQAWPFLRERVFTLAQLAGLPPVILPLVPLRGPQPRIAAGK
jgi:hypothetical protein